MDKQKIHRWFAFGFMLLTALMACTPGPMSTSSSDANTRFQDRSGIFTERQADRGMVLYKNECARCHGKLLYDGTQSPLAGAYFMDKWARDGRTAGDFFSAMKEVMIPKGVDLTDQGWVEVLAYILRSNGYSSGQQALTDNLEQLGRYPISNQNIIKAIPPGFIRGRFGVIPHSASPMQRELEQAVKNTRDWLAINHDYTGRRYSTLSRINKNNVNQLQLIKSFDLDTRDYFQSEPIVYEGIMYIATPYTTVALNAASAQQIWRHDWIPQAQESLTGYQGIAIKSGRVIRTTSDGYLMGLRIGNGSLLWARRIAETSAKEALTVGPVIYKSRILAGTSNWIGAFQIKNGEPVWRYKLDPDGIPPISTGTEPGQYISTLLSLNLKNEWLYTVASKNLVALNINTGVLENSDVLNENQIFGNGSGYNPQTDMLYLNKGNKNKTLEINGTTSSNASDILMAIDATTGATRWQHPSSQPIVPAVTTTAGDMVFAGDQDGNFMVLDARSGDMLFQFSINKPIISGIITYETDEKQYVAVMTGPAHASEDQSMSEKANVLIFGLPE